MAFSQSKVLFPLIGQYLLHESECDMAKYFMEQANLFSQPEAKIKPESEISCQITPTECISSI